MSGLSGPFINIPSNKIIKRQLIEIQKLTECPSDNVLLENFNNSTELKFVSSVEKLPYEIKEKVIKFLTDEEHKTNI